MPSKNRTNEPTLLTKDEAAAALGIADNYVGVLAKKNPILASGVVVDTYPGSRIRRWRIGSDVIAEYRKAEQAGETRSTRGGARRRAIKFPSLEVMTAVETVVKDQFGLTFEPVYKSRSKDAQPAPATNNGNGAAQTASLWPLDAYADNNQDDNDQSTEDEQDEEVKAFANQA